MIGELLIVIYFANGPETTTFPAGWTRLTVNTGLTAVHAAYRIATGSEGASIVVTSASSNRSAHLAYRITNYSGVPEVGTEASASNATPDPPSITPSWGAAQILVLAAVAQLASTAPTTPPTNYSNLTTSVVATNPIGAIAERAVTTATENPGTFSGGANAAWLANTIAIRGI